MSDDITEPPFDLADTVRFGGHFTGSARIHKRDHAGVVSQFEIYRSMDAFADYYGPGAPITPSFTETTPANMQRDPTMCAYAIVRAGPRLYPQAKTIYGYDDGQPLFGRGG